MRRWIGDERESASFISDMYQSPFADTAIRPLTLAHLCAIYERIGKIPERPKTVYRKVVSLLLEEWDQQRSVRRYSRYGKFEADGKFEFLSHLAYFLTIDTGRTIFSKFDFLRAYKHICRNFGLEDSQSNLVVSEIESHTGLFLQSGYGQFEFAHKSLQEFLSAEYIVRLPSIPNDPAIVLRLGAELAIASSISSNPSQYLSDLVTGAILQHNFLSTFYEPFINRLLLEKPDFYQDDSVMLALFALTTKWISNNRSTTREGRERNMWIDDDERYAQLLQLVTSGNPRDTLLKYYDLFNPSDATAGVVQIKRKARIKGFKFPTHILVPRSLVVPVHT